MTSDTVMCDTLSSDTTENNTAHEAASEKTRIREVWRCLEVARAELGTLMNLAGEDLAVPQVQSIVSKMGGAMKSSKKSKFNVKLSKELMETKIADAKEYVKDAEKSLEVELIRMKVKLGMDDKMINKLNRKAKWKAMNLRKKLSRKNLEKMVNLKRKRSLRNIVKATDRKLSPELSEYSTLDIMDIMSKEEESKKNVEDPNTDDVLVIDVVLSQEELKILCLPPKTCLNPSLNHVDFETAIEVSNTKIRYSMRDDDSDADSNPDKNCDDDDVTTEEDDKLEEKMRNAEAYSRMVFDDARNILDMRKRRVTDLPQNSKVFLPPPLNPMVESGLSIRKQQFTDTFADFMKSQCDDKGRQMKTSLTAEQRKGLTEIKKKIKEGEVILLETDKTGKFAVVSPVKFLEMGNKHVKDDKIIDDVELEEIQRECNGHVAMWIKILGMGEAWGHESRIRESLIQHSCVVPPMKLLVKDHKPLGPDGLPPTRPVVGASRGMNVALSNILSDVIEPVSKTIPNSGDVLSSEHLLSEINKLNEVWASQPPAGSDQGLPQVIPGVTPEHPEQTPGVEPQPQRGASCPTCH